MTSATSRGHSSGTLHSRRQRFRAVKAYPGLSASRQQSATSALQKDAGLIHMQYNCASLQVELVACKQAEAE